jgi:DNA mismatch repair ATPase MutS
MLVGKFYELYDVLDVKTGNPFTPIREATSIMNIVLKQKDLYLEAGVPEQSLHKFAQTLTKEGWTVVVVDQVKNASDLVIDRIPTRILSPGTHMEAAGPERLSVAALWVELTGNTASSVLDLMTGEIFSFYSTRPDEILHMMQVYGVKEVVIASEDNTKDESAHRSSFGLGANVAVRLLSANTFHLLTRLCQRV